MVYSELGRCNLSKLIEIKMVDFWAGIVHSNTHKLSNTVYRLLNVMYINDVYQSPWLSKIKTILDYSGLSNVWQAGVNFNRLWLKKCNTA